ncbi:Thioredoxin [Parasponia andersonii]|uniref:Thioredoxin n=1 Tax=Parasponia andersonii TaxID=3476 RepID=A0A2P5D2F3_PARAD|nr:Thioredoxin [Parasponia andersonii]
MGPRNSTHGTPTTKSPTNEGSSNSRIRACHTNDEWKNHFKEHKKKNKLVVIDFTTAWCGPCRSMEPVLKELSDKYTDVEFVKIDMDELPGVAAEYGIHVLPSFLLMKKGNQLDKVIGARKDELQNKIKKHRK